MSPGYDVVVVGARCAGSPTAMLFARAGFQVLLVDRVTFPKDTLSTLYIQQPGVARLHRWGVLDRVAATGCPPVHRISYELDGVRLAGNSLPFDGMAAAYAPRRTVLDAILLDEAVAAGVEFREACAFSDVLTDGDRVTGVRLRTPGGRSEERARLVVGADGMRSAVAARLGAPTLVEHPRRTCVYYTYWAGLTDTFEIYHGANQWVGAMPTNDGATGVAAYFPQSRFAEVRTDAMAAYLENVRTVAPDLFARMRDSGPADRLYGTGDQRNFFRRPAGPGWALVGDAAHHQDSITARGITQAFRQAELLVDAVGADLADDAALARGLRRYAEAHYRTLVDDYQHTLWVSKMAAPAYQRRMLAGLVGDAAGTARFFSVVSGVLKAGDGPGRTSKAWRAAEPVTA